MSNSQHCQDSVFFTITGEGDAHAFIEQYNLCRVDGWNKDETAQDQYQFDQMCLRFEPFEQPNHALNLSIDDVIATWCSYPQYLRRSKKLPADLQRTFHIVTHGVNFQSAGFHLNRDSIRELALLNAAVQLHGYQDTDDGLDFPYAKKIKSEQTVIDRGIDEYAYFYMHSETYDAKTLARKINLPVTDIRSIGDVKKVLTKDQAPILWEWSRLKVLSGLDHDHTIPEHLNAITKSGKWHKTIILSFQ
jgi:hypothetical protein